MMAKSVDAEKKPQRRSTRRSPAATSGLATNDTLWREQVERRAYEIFLSRGGTHGHALDDWIQAERELREEYGKTRRN